jgi:hypothetical protein
MYRQIENPRQPTAHLLTFRVISSTQVHDYTVNWPQVNGTVTQQNYSNLRGTVHICEGNGGVPQPSTYPCNATTCDIPCSPRAPFCRIHRRDPGGCAFLAEIL